MHKRTKSRSATIIGSVILLPWLLLAQKPVAELPRIHIDTIWSEPARGRIWSVHSAAEFTNSLERSSPGDVIVLDAGITYTGNFRVPAKANPHNKWIYVTSSAYKKLPAPGTRVSPNDATNMPKIVTPNASQAISLEDNAGYWRFVGIEIYSASDYHPNGYTLGVNYGYTLVDNFCYPNYPRCPAIPNLPSNIVYDRVYVHGDASHDVKAGICGNQIGVAVVDSYIADIHTKGQDSQAFIAYMTPGPIKLVNNDFESAGENVLFGGAGNGIGGWVPSDIEVKDNLLYKPLAWVPLSLPPINQYTEKNAFEIKSGNRVLFDHNIIRNVWAAAQFGAAVLLTPRSSQDGDVTLVTNITITNNQLLNVVAGFSTLSADSLCGTASFSNCHNPGVTGNWIIQNNLVTLWDRTQLGGIGANTGLIQLSGGSDRTQGSINVPTHDFLLSHNTVVPFGSQKCWQSIYITPTSNVPPYNVPPPWRTQPTQNLWIQDNVLCRQPTGTWSPQGMNFLNWMMGSPSTPPNDVTRRYYGNVMFVPPGEQSQSFPPHNLSTGKTFRYADPASGNLELVEPRWTQTTDGKPAGIDFATLPRLNHSEAKPDK